MVTAASKLTKRVQYLIISGVWLCKNPFKSHVDIIEGGEWYGCGYGSLDKIHG